MKASLIKKLIDTMGGRFSRELGIDLSRADSSQIFKWFLASKLFGARISTSIAGKTYREFERRGVTAPGKILEAGWDGLVSILDDGGYARYDFSTATKLLEIMEDLERDYGGDLNILHALARDEKDLENRLKALGKGIGDVTVNIFLRELRYVWEKARPEPSDLVQLAAKHLGLARHGGSLDEIEKVWMENKITGVDFCDFEAALLRLGKDYCRKERREVCPFREVCGRKKA